MTGNKRIFFLSASDRINYGDLLFPLIFKSFAVQNDYKFYNYGIVESDLSDFGAIPTKSYKDLLEKVKTCEGKLIIGGGEVFFADWKTLYGFINPVYARALKNKTILEIEKRVKFSKYFLSWNKVAVPFCPSKEELGNTNLQIYYNSVGGSFPYGKNKKEIKKIKKALNEATVVSVRDYRTNNEIKRLSINSKVVPDSALLISEFFSKKDIVTKITVDVSVLQNDFIFIQLGLKKGPVDLERFAQDLVIIGKETGLSIVLCPIGKAPGHEDDIILKKLRTINPQFHYFEPKNIYDIMYLISRSSLYMGTSLHGIITAQSYNVPFIGLNEKLKKVDNYTKTWIGEKYASLTFTQISKASKIYEDWDFNFLDMKTSEQKKLVRRNINSFF